VDGAGYEVVVPPDDMRLADEPDQAERENRQLRQNLGSGRPGRARPCDQPRPRRDLLSTPLAKALAFRGGTALYKLHLRPAARYSEDIDLVQVAPESIGPTLDELREALDPWLGEPVRKVKEGTVTLVYRFASEDPTPLSMRLKVEINSREHFTVWGHSQHRFSIGSRWFKGKAAILSYTLDELLGTELRALYQRKKGRDLFDLGLALSAADADPVRIVEAFTHYMKADGANITRATFEENLAGKLNDARFTADMGPLLAPGRTWKLEDAATRVSKSLLVLLPGEPWKGKAKK
jgi:predicted nucleotidyltransferase component of viral defense system